MNFSKAARQHLFIAEFALIVMQNVKPETLPEVKNLKKVKRVQENLGHVLKIINPNYPKMSFNHGQFKQYKKIQANIKKLYDSFFKDFIPSMDMVNTILYLVENSYKESKKSKNTSLKKAWENTLNCFHEFYEQVDQDTSFQVIDAGAVFGFKIEQIINQ